MILRETQYTGLLTGVDIYRLEKRKKVNLG